MSFDSEKLYELLSKPEFLRMEGLSGEVPIFIQTYEVADEDRAAQLIDGLASRLSTNGIRVASVDLFQLLLEGLEEDDLLEDIIRDECTFDRIDLLDTIRNYCDPKTQIIPKLIDDQASDSPQLTFINGVGHIFPFLRSHSILENLQPAMMNHPVIMFFPGTYNQVEGLGSKLTLFGCLPAKGYYRAFNLSQFRI